MSFPCNISLITSRVDLMNKSVCEDQPLEFQGGLRAPLKNNFVPVVGFIAGTTLTKLHYFLANARPEAHRAGPDAVLNFNVLLLVTISRVCSAGARQRALLKTGLEVCGNASGRKWFPFLFSFSCCLTQNDGWWNCSSNQSLSWSPTRQRFFIYPLITIFDISAFFKKHKGSLYILSKEIFVCNNITFKILKYVFPLSNRITS